VAGPAADVAVLDEDVDTESGTGAPPPEEQPPASTDENLELTPMLLFGPWAPDPLSARLSAHGLELTDDPARLADVAGIVVATRYAPPGAVSQIGELDLPTDVPLIVLAHPAGEQLAARLMACGGAAIVAEGNEEAIRLHIQNGPPEEDVLETFGQRLERSASEGDHAIFDRDPASNLPGPAALDERLLGLSQAGTVPRYGAIRILRSSSGRLGLEADMLLRRRLGSQMLQACHVRGAEIFAIGDREFVALAESLGSDEFASLGAELSTIAATFAPDRTAPLVLAMGHAGPESATDVATVRELAERGLEACVDGSLGARIVGAESLSRVFSATTELEALLHAVATVEEGDPRGPGHAARVETAAAEIGTRLGLEGRRLAALRLAARLHDIGKIRLAPGDRFPAGDTEDGEAYRRHPTLGAEIVRVPAGELVAAAIAGHHERWDGSGFPDGAAGTAIPLEARIVAVADAMDHAAEAGLPAPEVIAEIRASAGSRFDPGVVQVLDD